MGTILTVAAGDPGYEQHVRPLLSDTALRARMKLEADSDLVEIRTKTWFLAFIGDQLAGMCTSVPVDTGDNVTWVDGFDPADIDGCSIWETNYVLEAFRGQGVFKALFAARDAHALAAGRPVRTWVFDAVVKLHLRAGFAVRSDGYNHNPDARTRHHWTELHRPGRRPAGQG